MEPRPCGGAQASNQRNILIDVHAKPRGDSGEVTVGSNRVRTPEGYSSGILGVYNSDQFFFCSENRRDVRHGTDYQITVRGRDSESPLSSVYVMPSQGVSASCRLLLTPVAYTNSFQS
jgi:hypothetical protein